MNANELRHLYFEWMYELVDYENGHPRKRHHYKLLTFLLNKEFIFLIKRDENRLVDGVDLRYRFGYEEGYEYEEIEKIENDPCSVLEMMIALAFKCGEIMDNPEDGKQISFWFWKMIDNLGLNGMDDHNFDEQEANRIIDIFLYREYKPDGTGGLFKIPNCSEDLRQFEIWYQLMRYIDHII